MNRREIIIIVIAVAAGIFFLLNHFVFTGKTSVSEEERIAAAVSKINTFSETAGTSITLVKSKKTFLDIDYLISSAESEWENDPFIVYDLKYLKLDEAGIEKIVVDLSYTGFIQAGKKALAVINGMEYTHGELLKDVGYKVFSITSAQVVLLTEANKKIILQLEEN
jgi:hypothetical protein